MSIKEKVAYLKGLAEGLGLDSETKEGKLISVFIDTLSDMAFELEALGENALDIGEELDAISGDLSDVEEFLFDDDYDDDDDDFDGFGHFEDYDDDDECDCDHCHGDAFSYDVECPSCGADIVLDESDLHQGSATCPSCGEKLEFEFDDDEDDDDEDGDDGGEEESKPADNGGEAKDTE